MYSVISCNMARLIVLIQFELLCLLMWIYVASHVVFRHSVCALAFARILQPKVASSEDEGSKQCRSTNLPGHSEPFHSSNARCRE